MKASFLANWFFPIQSTSNRSLSGASAAAYKPMDLWQRFFYKVFIPKLCSLPWLVSLALLVRVKYLTTAAESGHCVVSGKKKLLFSPNVKMGFGRRHTGRDFLKRRKLLKGSQSVKWKKYFMSHRNEPILLDPKTPQKMKKLSPKIVGGRIDICRFRRSGVRVPSRLPKVHTYSKVQFRTWRELLP